MASKEATVYIVDVGASMSRRRSGRQATDLEWAMEYVWDKITTTVRQSERFLDQIDLTLLVRLPLTERLPT